jgi:hypothetical protein
MRSDWATRRTVGNTIAMVVAWSGSISRNRSRMIEVVLGEGPVSTEIRIRSAGAFEHIQNRRKHEDLSRGFMEMTSLPKDIS